jgi:hypothetical protein
MKIKNQTLICVDNSDIINGTFTIPESVTIIGNDAFRNCDSLISITIPNNITIIGNRAFWRCNSLNSIKISNSVTIIGNSAFYGCNNLTIITIPTSVETVDLWAFTDCTSLTSINDLKVKCIDGYPFVIKSTKKVGDYTILKGYNYQLVEPEKLIFVAQKGEFLAHGETLKAAIEDVNFKIYSETLKSEPIDLEQIVNICYYRSNTGACELGVKDWMKTNNVEEGIKVKEIIPILKKTNAYGVEKILNRVRNTECCKF